MDKDVIKKKVKALLKKSKSFLDTDKAPVALHAVNQGIVTALWRELQDTKKNKSPGEFGKENHAPVCLVAVDQGLVVSLWKEIQENLKK